MADTTIERTAERVVAFGGRHWLRATRGDAAGAGAVLVVEAAARRDGRWHRVDRDLVALTRAATRLLSCDAVAARAFVGHAIDLAGVPSRDDSPVTGLVRATYPLLASPPPWPLAAIPDGLPGDLLPAFRQRSLRDAARVLFPDRATRPVVRALGQVLTGRRTCDLFRLTLAMAAAPFLEPDRLVRVLEAPGGCSAGVALDAGQRDRLGALLAPLAPARRERLVREGLVDPAQRGRVRFVLGELDPARPPAVGGGWEELALAVALGTAVAS